MEDLFSMAAQGGSVEPEPVRRNAPLADRMRPRTLDEYVGQEKIKGNLRVYLEAARRRGAGECNPPDGWACRLEAQSAVSRFRKGGRSAIRCSLRIRFLQGAAAFSFRAGASF